MEPQKRFFDIEVRESQHAQGMVIGGIAIKYNDVATVPGGIRERILPGSFGKDCTKNVMLNAFHDRKKPLAKTEGGGLLLTDSDEMLMFEAELPETQLGKEIYHLVRKRVLTGASIEFFIESERYQENLRIVEKGTMFGLAVVDRPAFPKSQISARMAELEKQKMRYWN